MANVSGTYTRQVVGGVGQWDQADLIKHAASLPTKRVSVASIRELDSTMWFGGPRKIQPTIREVADHTRRIVSADLSFPIILSASGALMDGGASPRESIF